MVPMLRWERCSSGRFPRRNPDIAETNTKLMVTSVFSFFVCVAFLGMVKRQKQSRVIISPCKRSNSTYKHGSSRSDFRPVALEKLDDWDVIKVQHARKVLNLRMRKAPNSRNQLDEIIHCDLGGGWFHWSCINNNTIREKINIRNELFQEGDFWLKKSWVQQPWPKVYVLK